MHRPPGHPFGPTLLQSGTLAVRSVLRHRRRSGIALGAVAFGIMALILASGFIEWIFWATREGTIQSGLGHIHVARQGFQESGAADPERYLLPANSPVLAALRATPGVKTVAPRMPVSGLVSHGDATISFLGEGVDPQSEKKIGDISIIVKGENLSAPDANEVIMGQGLAANLGVDVGDTVVVLVSSSRGGINAVEARVRGLFATVSKAYDDSAMHMPIQVANRLVRRSGAHEWVVALRNTEDTSTMLQAFRARFADSKLEFTPWYDLADFYNKTVTLLSRQMGVIQAIIALVIVLTITNSMTMGVMERTSEIGTAMALGTRRRGILLQFVLEGVLLGVLGGLAGLAVGVVLAKAISAVGIPMPPPPGQARGYRAEMMVTVPAASFAFAMAVATAFVAAVYPALKASRIRIVDALRHNR